MILPPNECPTYFNNYLTLVANDVAIEMKNQLQHFPSFLKTIPEEKLLFRYASGKWSIKEVVGHISDTERIFTNRALRIARNDKTPMPGFDEEAYVLATDFDSKTMDELLSEFCALRQSSLSLLKSLDDIALKRIGTASNKTVSARALFYFMVGHLRHHEILIKERYIQNLVR